MSGIEEIIGEIEEYVENCKFQPLSNSKIIVNKDELEELLDELRDKTPEEIKRYQKILSNKDAILKDAQDKADKIIMQAKERANTMVSESEIMQQAYTQANEVVTIASNQAQEILDKATEDADGIRTAAIGYTDELMSELQEIIVNAVGYANEHYGALTEALTETLNVIQTNRRELSGEEVVYSEAAE